MNRFTPLLVVFLALMGVLPTALAKGLLIGGTVVDEQNVPISGATVTACYFGWGFSSGSLVWDKAFCSNPVITNTLGQYSIDFKGSSNMHLYAKKDGWTQMQDASANENTNASKITLVPTTVAQQRNEQSVKKREALVKQRLPRENLSSYYCRIVMPYSQQVTVHYQKEMLIVTPRFLALEDRTIFAIKGTASSVQDLLQHAQLRAQGTLLQLSLLKDPDGAESTCPQDVRLIEISPTTSPKKQTGAEPLPIMSGVERIELLIPNIRAMLDLEPWVP